MLEPVVVMGPTVVEFVKFLLLIKLDPEVVVLLEPVVMMGPTVVEIP